MKTLRYLSIGLMMMGASAFIGCGDQPTDTGNLAAGKISSCCTSKPGYTGGKRGQTYDAQNTTPAQCAQTAGNLWPTGCVRT